MPMTKNCSKVFSQLSWPSIPPA